MPGQLGLSRVFLGRMGAILCSRDRIGASYICRYVNGVEEGNSAGRESVVGNACAEVWSLEVLAKCALAAFGRCLAKISPSLRICSKRARVHPSVTCTVCMAGNNLCVEIELKSFHCYHLLVVAYFALAYVGIHIESPLRIERDSLACLLDLCPIDLAIDDG
jgi:hypothetical protein